MHYLGFFSKSDTHVKNNTVIICSLFCFCFKLPSLCPLSPWKNASDAHFVHCEHIWHFSLQPLTSLSHYHAVQNCWNKQHSTFVTITELKCGDYCYKALIQIFLCNYFPRSIYFFELGLCAFLQLKVSYHQDGSYMYLTYPGKIFCLFLIMSILTLI